MKVKINIGAVLRVTPIKDVKTMIQAFAFAKAKGATLETMDHGTRGMKMRNMRRNVLNFRQKHLVFQMMLNLPDESTLRII